MSIAALNLVFGDRQGQTEPIRTDTDLQWRVLVILANYADEHLCAYPSVGRIAWHLNVEGRSVRRVLRQLEEAGLIECIGKAPDERIPEHRRPFLYRITGQAGQGTHQSGEDSPVRGTPDSPDRGTPDPPVPQNTNTTTKRNTSVDEPTLASAPGADESMPESTDERAVYLTARFEERISAARAVVGLDPIKATNQWPAVFGAMIEKHGNERVTQVLIWLVSESPNAGWWLPKIKSPVKVRDHWGPLTEAMASEAARQNAPRSEPAPLPT